MKKKNINLDFFLIKFFSDKSIIKKSIYASIIILAVSSAFQNQSIKKNIKIILSPSFKVALNLKIVKKYNKIGKLDDHENFMFSRLIDNILIKDMVNNETILLKHYLLDIYKIEKKISEQFDYKVNFKNKDRPDVKINLFDIEMIKKENIVLSIFSKKTIISDFQLKEKIKNIFNLGIANYNSNILNEQSFDENYITIYLTSKQEGHFNLLRLISTLIFLFPIMNIIFLIRKYKNKIFI